MSWFPHPPIPHLPLLAGCVLVASFHKHHLDLLLTYLLVYLLRKGNCCNSWFSSHLMNSGFTFAFWKGRGRVYRWSCQVVRTCSLRLPGPVAACQAELWLCGVCLPAERASETMLEAGGSPPPPSPCSPVLHTPGSAFFGGPGCLCCRVQISPPLTPFLLCCLCLRSWCIPRPSGLLQLSDHGLSRHFGDDIARWPPSLPLCLLSVFQNQAYCSVF